MVLPNDIAILKSLARYYVLKTSQIRRLHFQSDKTGRITRRRLSILRTDGYINKTHMQVVNPDRIEHSEPFYFPSKKGTELLTLDTGDTTWIATNCTCPQWQNLVHWSQLSDLHIQIDAALASQQIVQLPKWINEFDVVNKTETDPAKRFTLYTLIRREPKLVAVPDAAFALQVGKFLKAYYVEMETGTNSVHKAAAEKTPGYATMASQQLHHRHFPGSLDSFNVLCFCPHPNWRDALRKGFEKKEGAALWRFCSLTDVKPDASFFSSPIFYPCEGEPKALVKGGVS